VVTSPPDANWNVTALWENTTSGLMMAERYEYDPYGTVRIYRGKSSYSDASEQGTVTGRSLKWLDANLPENPVLYAGYFRDSETQKYHVRNRMLDLDRWMQWDPTAYVDGADLYQYGKGGPVSSTDPSGEAYIWPPGTYPACCKYSTGASAAGTMPRCARRQTTMLCQVWQSPEQCCKCGEERIIGSRGALIKTLDSATAGKCCACTMQYVYLQVGTRHAAIYIKCENNYQVFLQFYGLGSPVPSESTDGTPLTIMTDYTGLWDSTTIDCDCVAAIKSRAATWKGYPWVPPVYDCWSFARDLMRFARQNCYDGT
jgi:RHS repeat-associated protein